MRVSCKTKSEGSTFYDAKQWCTVALQLLRAAAGREGHCKCITLDGKSDLMTAGRFEAAANALKKPKDTVMLHFATQMSFGAYLTSIGR